MTTSLSDNMLRTLSNDPTTTAEIEKPFDEYFSPDGKLLTRRPDADSKATKRLRHLTHIVPDQTVASLAVSAKSVEQRHNISKASITGKIKRLLKRQLLTASAAAEIYGQKVVTDAYLRLGPQEKTEPKDATFIAVENSCNVNDEDLRVKSAGLGYDAANFDFSAYNLDTTNIVLQDLTGALRGKDIIPSLIDDEIEFCCKYNSLTDCANQTSNQTVAISQDVLIVEWEELTPEEYEMYRKAYKDPLGAFEFTFLQTYMPPALVVSGTTELNTADIKFNHIVPFAWATLQDANVDLNNVSLDYSPWSSYLLSDTNGNALFQTDKAQYVYKNENDDRMARIVDSSFLFRKNIIPLNCGAGEHILTVLQQQCYAPAYDFKGTERFRITSTDTNADRLQCYVYYYSKVGL